MPRVRSTETYGPAWLVRAAVIARQSYLEGRSKVEIGDDLGLSRFKVARVLDEAQLGLRRTIVLAQGASGDQGYDEMGRVGADLLAELVSDVAPLTGTLAGALVESATARSLAGQEGIRNTLDRIGSVTIAMVMIGGRLFDARGQAVPGSIDERVLGMTLQQLLEIDEVVGLAYGAGRAAAVSAAAGGLIETLACDADLARTLLAGTEGRQVSA